MNIMPEHFDLFEFFDGKTRALGVFESPLGRCKRTLSVDITGTVVGDKLTLEESFVFGDGEQDLRIWTITKLEDGRYQGVAADVLGQAQGEVSGNQLHWCYQVLLPVGGRQFKIRFDDRMYLVDDKVLLNRARLLKWGLPVGSVTLVFTQEGRS